jgi:hypothetical protein
MKSPGNCRFCEGREQSAFRGQPDMGRRRGGEGRNVERGRRAGSCLFGSELVSRGSGLPGGCLLAAGGRVHWQAMAEGVDARSGRASLGPMKVRGWRRLDPGRGRRENLRRTSRVPVSDPAIGCKLVGRTELSTMHSVPGSNRNANKVVAMECSDSHGWRLDRDDLRCRRP